MKKIGVNEKINREIACALKKHNCQGKCLVIGVSGGSDSMCLLYSLKNLAKQFKLKLIIAHLNHSLRGKESDKDEKFVEEIGKKLGLKVETKKLDIKKFKKEKKLNLEEAARIKRYEFLNQIKKKYKAKFIVLAHTLNDNIETILLNFIRGTSLRGLSGMPEETNGILKPILNVTKKETEEYCEKNRIKFRIDKTNFDISLKRNFVRHKLIPLIENINKSFVKIMARKSRYFKETHEFLSCLAKEWIKKNCVNKKSAIICDSKSFAKIDDFLKKLIIEKIYAIFNKSTIGLEEIHIEEILSIINKNISNKKKDIGGRISIKKVKGRIIFE